MNKKMKEILGKQYKLLINNPLNPYGTYWPSNFLKQEKMLVLNKELILIMMKLLYIVRIKRTKTPFSEYLCEKNNNDDLGKDEKDNNIKFN